MVTYGERACGRGSLGRIECEEYLKLLIEQLCFARKCSVLVPARLKAGDCCGGFREWERAQGGERLNSRP